MNSGGDRAASSLRNDAYSAPGPRRAQWSKGKGRAFVGDHHSADAARTEDRRHSFEQGGGYLDDDFVAERIPGGASPFGVKKTAVER